MLDANDKELNEELAERFKSLPKVVQDAITSAGVEHHLRTLADTHQLHLDQWQLLENEVMLTLFGFKNPKDLKQNIKDDIGVPDNTAASLAEDISRIVFEPIRKELERGLDHPDAEVKTQTGVEQAASSELSASRQQQSAENSIPPAPIASAPVLPDTKAVRAPISAAYKPGEASSARKDVVNDPYRESPK